MSLQIIFLKLLLHLAGDIKIDLSVVSYWYQPHTSYSLVVSSGSRTNVLKTVEYKMAEMCLVPPAWPQYWGMDKIHIYCGV